MYFSLERICAEIGNENKIIIYGAGYFAGEVYDRMLAIGWKDRIQYFVVTSMDAQPEYIDDVPVIELKDLILDNDKVCMLVAVGDTHIKEIKDILSEFPLEQVYYLWDYMVSEEKRRTVLLNASFEEICLLAFEEYIWKHPCYLKDKKRLLSEMQIVVQEHKNKQISDKSIVYVMEEETARNAKIIKALLGKGYKIIVIQYDRKRRYVAEKELMDYGIILRRFDCMWEFIVESLKYRPMFYIHDIAWVRFEFVNVSIRYKKIWGRIVVAPYETFMGAFVHLPETVFEDERFCLENADAVIWRYFSKEYLQDKVGYQFRGDSVHLLDNCGGYALSARSGERSSEKLKLCCVVAQIGCFLRTSSTSYTRQARFADLLDKLDESCELNVFAWSANADEEKELVDLGKKYKNFKYFLKVEHKDLIYQISTYDYGLCIWTDEKIPVYPEEAEVLSGGIVTCTEGTYRYSVANRYFDYLDAELAVITTFPEKLCEYLQQYDVIIRMNSCNLDIEYLKKNKKHYRERAKAAKKELLMSKQINKLTDMFERMCSKEDGLR